MSDKPELIVVSQNLLGGGASFHRNMLSNFPKDFFDIRCIYLNPTDVTAAKSLEVALNPNDAFFSYGHESLRKSAKKLAGLISDKEGAIITNLENELISLDLYRKPMKTTFFICHDDGFISLGIKYESIIDIFIAHNILVYQHLLKLLSNRSKDIHFIQHGVSVQSFQRQVNSDKTLKAVFVARHYVVKGIYDLPRINEILLERGTCVEWTILGDGPERENFMKEVENTPNFYFHIPKTSSEVLEVLKTQDIFILPSRNDGLPVALLESMSVGCVPVIGNFSEGIKKVVTDQIGFVLTAGDNDSFAEKIISLSNDRSLLKTLSNNCIDKVKDEFDIKKQALEYYCLYKNYKQFSRKHKIGIKDIFRIVSYSGFYNKMFYWVTSFKRKLTN